MTFQKTMETPEYSALYLQWVGGRPKIIKICQKNQEGNCQPTIHLHRNSKDIQTLCWTVTWQHQIVLSSFPQKALENPFKNSILFFKYPTQLFQSNFVCKSTYPKNTDKMKFLLFVFAIQKTQYQTIKRIMLDKSQQTC